MATTAIENYLKQILLLEQASADNSLVSMGQLAESMQIVPGTATAMVKRLAESGRLTYEPYAGVRLTAKGRTQALAILRRHRLIETFLVQILGLDWSEVHEEAEDLEHALSDRVLKKIDALLQFPTVDPHGDPIPSAEGDLQPKSHRNIMDCQPGDEVRIARIADQGQEFLQFIDRCKLKPGTLITITTLDPIADVVIVRHTATPPPPPHPPTPPPPSPPSPPSPAEIQMGRLAASKIFVEPARQ